MRKPIFIILILFSCQAFFSCDEDYSETELRANFTAEQISDLTKIRDFFITQVCESDFQSCYEETKHEYLESTFDAYRKAKYRTRKNEYIKKEFRFELKEK